MGQQKFGKCVVTFSESQAEGIGWLIENGTFANRSAVVYNAVCDYLGYEPAGVARKTAHGETRKALRAVVRLPEIFIREIDTRVDGEVARNRSELFRKAVTALLAKHGKDVEPWQRRRHLGKRKSQIMASISRFRFVTSGTIMQLGIARKTAQHHLRDLTKMCVLNREYDGRQFQYRGVKHE